MLSVTTDLSLQTLVACNFLHLSKDTRLQDRGVGPTLDQRLKTGGLPGISTLQICRDVLFSLSDFFPKILK